MKRYAVTVTGPDEIELTIGPDHNSRSVLLKRWEAYELVTALEEALEAVAETDDGRAFREAILEARRGAR